MLFKPIKEPRGIHHGATIIKRWVGWERGPWLLAHEEHGGVKLWTHRLCLYPIVAGSIFAAAKPPDHVNMYTETRVDPDFRIENGAVAAIVFTRIMQRLSAVDNQLVPDKWQEIAHELEWEKNIDQKFDADGNVNGEFTQATRCYIGRVLAQHWLKEKGMP